MPRIDLLVYHDFSENLPGAIPPLGTAAKDWLGDEYEGFHIVAAGPPIHDSKDVTLVLARSPRAMADIHERLNRPIIH